MYSVKVRCQALKYGDTANDIYACVAVSCGSLSAVENGRKIGSGNTTLGFTVVFECDRCYQLEGSPNRTCQADKNWSGTNATCNREYAITLRE